MVQKSVYTAQALGVPGEFYDDSPRRVAPYILRSNAGKIAATGSVMSVSGSTLEGGALSTVLPTVACVFTAGAEDNEAVIGGTGAFRGVLVGPKQYANYMNLEATMSLPDGSIGQLATMGHILVKVGNAVSPDDAAVYNNVTGEISGIESSGSAPAGSTKIPNAKFILRSAAAGETAILEITD